jgi:hypothetical protein
MLIFIQKTICSLSVASWMLPTRTPLFGPFNSVNLHIFLSASYSSCSKYSSYANFYSTPLLFRWVVIASLPSSQDLVSGNEHTASRQKFKNSVRKRGLNKKLIWCRRGKNFRTIQLSYWKTIIISWDCPFKFPNKSKLYSIHHYRVKQICMCFTNIWRLKVLSNKN